MKQTLWLVGLATVFVSACNEEDASAPAVALAVAGQPLGANPVVVFTATAIGTTTTVPITLTNEGPGALELDGQPAFLIDDDDHLAFRVAPPAKLRWSSGERFDIQVTFAPTSLGSAHGALVIPIAHGDPLTIALQGEGSAVPNAALELSVDGQPISDHFDCGLVEPNASTSHGLLLKNSGTAPLQFASGTPLVIIGQDADAFSLSALPAQGLAAGASVEIALTCAPKACRPQVAELTIAFGDSALPLRRIALTATTGANLQSYSGFAGTDLPLPAVHDVALSSARSSTNGSGYLLALGDQAHSSEAGQVRTTVWNGCAIGQPPETAGPGALNLTTTHLGTQVDLSDDGRLMLVSATDVAAAWILDVGLTGRMTLRARLATFEKGEGQGRSAALSGDGKVAVIGNPLADSQWQDHGAMLLYTRLGDAWSNFPEARLRLEPSRRDQVLWLGTSVQASHDGSVIASGALVATGSGRIPDGNAMAIALVYEYAKEGGQDTWGVAGGPTVEPSVREETVRLNAGVVAPDNLARIALAANGQALALAVRRADHGLDVHLFERVGGKWGLEAASDTARLANHVLSFGEAGDYRLALGPDGSFLIVGDNSGLREYLRGDAWSSAPALHNSWPVPLSGPFALSADGKALAGMDTHGAAWLVTR